MSFPAFFADIPTLTLFDPLAKLLGAPSDGHLTYSFADAVQTTGHSCPTVAGAFLMASRGLQKLYGTALPERGAIRVECRETRDYGVTGVQARVFSLLTGAAETDGFKGLAGKYDRRGLLSFGVPMQGQFRFTRVDTQAMVEIDYHPEVVPATPAPRNVLQKALIGTATADEIADFQQRWQDRVRRILVVDRDNPDLVTCSDFPLAPAPSIPKGSVNMSEALDQIDVRRVVPRERHARIFAMFDALKSGGAFVLVNDHDPKPLYYQFQAQHGEGFSWDYLEQGPEVWRVRIAKS